MNDEQKDKFLSNLYYSEHLKLGRDRLFYHVSHTLNNKNISRRYILAFLNKQESHQLFQQRKKPTNIRPILSSKPGAILQVDLMDFSSKVSRFNKYILNVIDVFSRKVWLVALRNKSAKTIDKYLKPILDEIEKDHKISVIQTDNGLEFTNIKNLPYKHLLSNSYTPQNQSVVERSNGSLKRILTKILFDKKTTEWSKYIPVIQDIYNDSLSRITKTTPNLAYNSTIPEQVDIHTKQVAVKALGYKEINTVLKVGDRVRIVVQEEAIQKKMLPIYSVNIYKIHQVIQGHIKNLTIPRYKLIDGDGDIVKNTYPLSKLLVIPETLQKK